VNLKIDDALPNMSRFANNSVCVRNHQVEKTGQGKIGGFPIFGLDVFLTILTCPVFVLSSIEEFTWGDHPKGSTPTQKDPRLPQNAHFLAH